MTIGDAEQIGPVLVSRHTSLWEDEGTTGALLQTTMAERLIATYPPENERIIPYTNPVFSTPADIPRKRNERMRE